MDRPVRPVALVILTVCMVYPGITMLYQGSYPFINGDWFTLVGDQGLWHALAIKIGLNPVLAEVAKMFVGLLWCGGVLGLWAGDQRAYPLALLAAVLTLGYPGGGMVMAILGLICLLGFREKASEVLA